MTIPYRGVAVGGVHAAVAEIGYDVRECVGEPLRPLTVARKTGATSEANAIGDTTRTVLRISFLGAGTWITDKNIRHLLLSVM